MRFGLLFLWLFATSCFCNNESFSDPSGNENNNKSEITEAVNGTESGKLDDQYLSENSSLVSDLNETLAKLIPHSSNSLSQTDSHLLDNIIGQLSQLLDSTSRKAHKSGVEPKLFRIADNSNSVTKLNCSAYIDRSGNASYSVDINGFLDLATVQCNRGYLSNYKNPDAPYYNFYKLTCLDAGIWETYDNPIECVKSCNLAEYAENNGWDINESWFRGIKHLNGLIPVNTTQIEIVCPEGHLFNPFTTQTVSQSGQISCETSGQFNYDPPCVKGCKALATQSHGQTQYVYKGNIVAGISLFPVDTVATLSCGTSAVPDEDVSTVCVDPENPHFDEMLSCDCKIEDMLNATNSCRPEISNVSNQVEKDTVPAGTQVKFHCCDGFYPSDLVGEVTCERLNRWNSVAQCIAGCKTIGSYNPAIMNPIVYSPAAIVSDTYRIGTMAKFSCKSGFHIGSLSISTCSADTTWTVLPRCLIGCKPVELVENGQIEYHPSRQSNGVYERHTRAVLSCLEGFYLSTLNSLDSLICEGPLWNNTKPKCKRGCAPFEKPHMTLSYSSTMIVGNLYQPDTVATPSCEPKFHLSSNDHWVCKKGKWKGPEIECTPAHYCNVSDEAFEICEQFGSRSCDILNGNVHNLCLDCCKIHGGTKDHLCLETGCYCNSLETSKVDTGLICQGIAKSYEHKVLLWADSIIQTISVNGGYSKMAKTQSIAVAKDLLKDFEFQLFIAADESSAYNWTAHFLTRTAMVCKLDRRGHLGMIIFSPKVEHFVKAPEPIEFKNWPDGGKGTAICYGHANGMFVGIIEKTITELHAKYPTQQEVVDQLALRTAYLPVANSTYLVMSAEVGKYFLFETDGFSHYSFWCRINFASKMYYVLKTKHMV